MGIYAYSLAPTCFSPTTQSLTQSPRACSSMLTHTELCQTYRTPARPPTVPLGYKTLVPTPSPSPAHPPLPVPAHPLTYQYFQLFAAISRLYSGESFSLSILYNLCNVAFALPVNALHFHQLYANRAEPPHTCYAWLCVLLSLFYAIGCMFDLQAAVGPPRSCYASSTSRNYATMCEGRCTSNFNATAAAHTLELGNTACDCPRAHPYCWVGEEWDSFLPAPNVERPMKAWEVTWRGWAVTDGVASWTWANTGYLFLLLAREGRRGVLGASAAAGGRSGRPYGSEAHGVLL